MTDGRPPLSHVTLASPIRPNETAGRHRSRASPRRRAPGSGAVCLGSGCGTHLVGELYPFAARAMSNPEFQSGNFIADEHGLVAFVAPAPHAAPRSPPRFTRIAHRPPSPGTASETSVFLTGHVRSDVSRDRISFFSTPLARRAPATTSSNVSAKIKSSDDAPRRATSVSPDFPWDATGDAPALLVKASLAGSKPKRAGHFAAMGSGEDQQDAQVDDVLGRPRAGQYTERRPQSEKTSHVGESVAEEPEEYEDGADGGDPTAAPKQYLIPMHLALRTHRPSTRPIRTSYRRYLGLAPKVFPMTEQYKRRLLFMDAIAKSCVGLATNMVEQGKYKPTSADLDYILTTLVKNAQYDIALEVVDEAERSWGLLPPTSVKTCTILIHLFGKAMNIERAFQMFEYMQEYGPEPNVVTYNTLIAACTKCGMIESAFSVLKHMEEIGVNPDKFTFGALMDSCSKEGDVTRTFEVAGMMERAGIEKDGAIYSILIEACGRAKQLDLAFLVFEEMKRKGCWPNLITFAVLIDACANCYQPHRAFQLFNEIRHWGMEPNVVAYTSLIDACCKSACPEQGELVLEAMLKRGDVKPNEVTFGALIDGWCRQDELERAFNLLGRMAVEGLRPTQVTLNRVYVACKRLGNMKMAFECVKTMKQYAKNHVLKTVFADFIQACLHDNIDLAVAAAEDAYQEGLLIFKDTTMQAVITRLKLQVFTNGNSHLKKRVSGLLFV